jgi:hypothetical protein
MPPEIVHPTAASSCQAILDVCSCTTSQSSSSFGRPDRRSYRAAAAARALQHSVGDRDRTEENPGQGVEHLPTLIAGADAGGVAIGPDFGCNTTRLEIRCPNPR